MNNIRNNRFIIILCAFILHAFAVLPAQNNSPKLVESMYEIVVKVNPDVFEFPEGVSEVLLNNTDGADKVNPLFIFP